MLKLKVSVLLHTEVLPKGPISAIIFELYFLLSSVVRLVCKPCRARGSLRVVADTLSACIHIGNAEVDHLASEIYIRTNKFAHGFTKK